MITAGVWVGMVMAKPLEADSAVTPGTIEDPVVTKSYVDEQIAKISGGGTTGGSTDGAAEAAGLEVVEVPIGKTLMVSAGGEVVVRVGKAVAYSSDTNGISDLTGGIDIKSGKDVPTNHLIWFPRDGRGIKGHPDEIVPLTVLVKGSYTIK
ncbi:hypothetical protein D3P08_18490 [Paenibacillus nanensis]|uniref:Uncharacterized protein n=2 Tax=Paenibacillus nanensis TaxID=393251 RepID=A0A3A1URD1_9BACL|nr:hypothetical protein D3P08_18490 [Paenibacillus nanensis]